MKKIKLLYLLIFVIVLSMFLYYQNNSIVITNYKYESNKISKDFDDFKILQLSDLHNNIFGENNINLINAINYINPNALFITGDLIDRNVTNIKIIDNLLENIKYNTYYITGNHEYSSKRYKKLKEVLIKYEVNILENKYTTIKLNDSLIEVYGVNDPSLIAMSRDLTDKEIINNEINFILNDNDNFKILLSHRPELFNEYIKYNFNLVFTGHAHGGQIRLPFINGLYAPQQGFFPKYTNKYYQKNSTTMYVSRGLGNNVIVPRIFNRPELVVVTLKKI
jgi:predicted MPP superfamily phosphohydrolase